MTFGTYAAPCAVHPDRVGATRTTPILWAVLHTSEGNELDASAEVLCDAMGRPGDRPTSSGGVYGSSYHVVFDTDCIRPAVPYATVSYSAGGGNASGIHGCFPGKAGQTREQWLDESSRAMIRQCARWLVDVGMAYTIPVHRKMSVDEMKAMQKGLADHYTVTLAFRKTDHTDVGPGFPWDVLAADIQEVLDSNKPTPPVIQPPVVVPTPSKKEPEMLYIIQPAFSGATASTEHLVKFEDGHIERAFNSTYAYAQAKGIPIVPETSPDHYNTQRARMSEIPMV